MPATATTRGRARATVASSASPPARSSSADSSSARAVARRTRLVMPMPRAVEAARSASVIPAPASIGSSDDPGPEQRGVEPVGRVSEVGLRRGGPEPGVDADEEQPHARTEQVGDLRVAERLELGAGEAGHRLSRAS